MPFLNLSCASIPEGLSSGWMLLYLVLFVFGKSLWTRTRKRSRKFEVVKLVMLVFLAMMGSAEAAGMRKSCKEEMETSHFGVDRWSEEEWRS